MKARACPRPAGGNPPPQNHNAREAQAKALAPYWDENADIVKSMLDFALARLA